MRSSTESVAAGCAAALVAYTSIIGVPRSSLVVGVKVVSPCSVTSTRTSSSKREGQVSIACTEVRRAEVRTQPPQKGANLKPAASRTVVIEGDAKDLRIVEVFF